MELPATAPFIAAGIRISAAVALILAVATEILSGFGEGLGIFIAQAGLATDGTRDVLAGVVWAGALGLVINGVLVWGERRLFPWTDTGASGDRRATTGARGESPAGKATGHGQRAAGAPNRARAARSAAAAWSAPGARPGVRGALRALAGSCSPRPWAPGSWPPAPTGASTSRRRPEIARHAHDLWFSGPPTHLFLTPAATENILPSLSRMTTGFALAAAVGTPSARLWAAPPAPTPSATRPCSSPGPSRPRPWSPSSS